MALRHRQVRLTTCTTDQGDKVEEAAKPLLNCIFQAWHSLHPSRTSPLTGAFLLPLLLQKEAPPLKHGRYETHISKQYSYYQTRHMALEAPLQTAGIVAM
jgi:hypothetical protein